MAILQAQSSHSLLQQLITAAISHPFFTAFTILAIACLITRVITGFKYWSAISRNQQSSSSVRNVPVVPYWIPWLGQAVPFALGATPFLDHMTKVLGPEGSAFGIYMGGMKNNIITSPSLARQILFDRHVPIRVDSFVFYVMKNVWDDRGTMRAIDPAHLWGPVHAALSGMLRDSFVSKGIAQITQALQERTWNMVSGSRSVVDQSVWERAGRVEIISGSDSTGSKPFIAEASLHLLLRDFVGDIATNVLFGHEFAQNNPDVLRDLWIMDAKFNKFLAGLPSWWPGMGAAYQARERLVHAVEDHNTALAKYLDGEDPGSPYSDLSDVSSVIVERLQAFRAAGTTPRGYATGNAVILWAMNVNANQIIFWLIWYVFSDRALLSELRAELAPYVKFAQAPDNGLPIKDAPKLDIDHDSLWNKCPLLKGTFYETLRLEAAGSSFKIVDEDFVVTESEEDAKILGKKGPESYLLSKGELLCIPHGVHQNDERYFRDPQRFDPRRFWAKPDLATSDTKDQSKPPMSSSHNPEADIKVEYGTMKAWGGGKNMCKGKAFAEREVILFSAAIIMQWEMIPMGNNGKWVHPGRTIAAGAYTPKKEVKVRLWRAGAW